MAKTYKNIQAFLNIEALEVPSDGSIFLVEALAEPLEERIGQAIAKEETLSAKMEEIVKLNDTIKQLRDSIAEKDATISEKDGSINTLNEQVTSLNEQITNLNNDAEGNSNALTEKDNTIASLNEQLNTLNQTLAEKDAEITRLAGKAPEMPTSKIIGKTEETKEEDNIQGPHNVATAGMTLREKAAALEQRNNELLGLR